LPTEKAPAERTDRETLSETEKRDKWRKVQKDATSHQDTADEHRARAKKKEKSHYILRGFLRYQAKTPAEYNGFFLFYSYMK